jgi:hypothetical protein
MSSSPTEDRLRQVAQCYDHALEAVLTGDVERAESLLQWSEDQLRTVQSPAADNVLEQGARSRALDAYGRLLDALRQARDATLSDLMQVRRGQQALAGYGGRADHVGTVYSDDV